MSALIEIYQDSINKNFSSLHHKYYQCEITSSVQRMNIIIEIENLMKETESVIKNFTIESTMQNDKSLAIKGKDYKETLNKFKQKIKKMQEIELQPCDSNNHIDNSSNEKLLTGSDALAYNSFEKLQKATRAALEIESASGNVMFDLNNQTDQMKNAKLKIGNMNDQLSSSSSLLGNMITYQNRNKVVIAAFAIALLAAFSIIIFMKLY